MEKDLEISFHPLIPERWGDFEKLFGPRGAIGGCWCMWWRIKRADFEKHKGDGNRQSMRVIVESGQVPGILAYADGEAIAWCSIAPREEFPVLGRSPNLKPVDDQPVWSLVCFFIGKPYRHLGLSLKLIGGAVEYAHQQGAQIIEGYPVEPKKDQTPDIYAFTGLASTFRKFGFKEVARRSETRPIMRYFIEQ